MELLVPLFTMVDCHLLTGLSIFARCTNVHKHTHTIMQWTNEWMNVLNPINVHVCVRSHLVHIIHLHSGWSFWRRLFVHEFGWINWQPFAILSLSLSLSLSHPLNYLNAEWEWGGEQKNFHFISIIKTRDLILLLNWPNLIVYQIFISWLTIQCFGSKHIYELEVWAATIVFFVELDEPISTYFFFIIMFSSYIRNRRRMIINKN